MSELMVRETRAQKLPRGHHSPLRIHYIANLPQGDVFRINKLETLCQEDRAKLVTMNSVLVTCRRCNFLYKTFPHLTLVSEPVKR